MTAAWQARRQAPVGALLRLLGLTLVGLPFVPLAALAGVAWVALRLFPLGKLLQPAGAILARPGAGYGA